MRRFVGAVVGLVVVSGLLSGCGSKSETATEGESKPTREEESLPVIEKPTQEESIAAIEKLGGKNQPDLSDPETLQKILGEALLQDALEERGSGGGKLLYVPDGQTPYTGWVKKMYSKGVVESLGYSKDGKLEGFSTRWHENGQKALEVTYKDGKREGLATEWHDNGQKMEEGTYKDGKLEGPFTRWHDNGQKAEEVTYKDGMPESFTSWHENGRKERKFTYEDGMQEGLETKWHDNGQKAAEATFKGGKREGPFTRWHENGEKAEEGTYKDGKREGLAISWDEDGKEIARVRFKDGRNIERARSR